MPAVTRALSLGLPLSMVLACLPKPTPPVAPTLQDRVFVSQSITDDGVPRELVEGTRLRLAFHEGSRLSASAGCNTLGASYRLEGAELVLEDAAVTEIGCDPALHAQDTWYFDFLGSRPTLALVGDALVLAGGDTRIEYLDQEVATPDVALAGPTWTVDTIIRGGAAMHANWADPATITFGEGNTFEVFTGCNSGSGTYRVQGDAITFEGLAVTERACLDEDVRELEEVVLAVLTGPQPVEWEITVDRLSLRGDGVGLELAASRD